MNSTTQIMNVALIDDTLTIYFHVFIILLLIGILILLIAIFYLIRRYYDRTKYDLVELNLNFRGPSLKYKIDRNYENLEIAHKIYIELTTRMAAIPIDEKYDVIVEVYNSWYELFKTTRLEIKKISGKTLKEDPHSDELVKMTMDILNLGLRPHLTKYQANFRKWYDDAIKDTANKGKSPQQIQQEFPQYRELIEDLGEVTNVLIEYKNQLGIFIINKKTK
ncbi:hypothetical protein [uncultured Methanoregula sp.]|uniref:hypothetical protein n=1 Tax=uncultured Methanoregula sp. TaxID=1005933 RepID=UPI002AAB4BE7|nr:hypothetical protein [uncultured Methanoregula sp.]